jgi:hypothetical protein
MPKSFHVVCLEPGADNPKKHTPPPEPEPPEGFVDNTVYRYRIDEDGNKVLIGTMEAFPEGWHRSKTDWEKGFQKKKEDEKIMARYYWKALWPQAQELLAQGLSTAKVAEKLGIDAPALRCKIDRERRKAEKQTPNPTSAQVGSQEPERESQEPAQTSLDPPEDEVKEEGFGPEDEEPIPYQVAEDATLDEMKVIWIENVLTHCTQAKTQLQYIQAIMDLRV